MGAEFHSRVHGGSCARGQPSPGRGAEMGLGPEGWLGGGTGIGPPGTWGQNGACRDVVGRGWRCLAPAQDPDSTAVVLTGRSGCPKKTEEGTVLAFLLIFLPTWRHIPPEPAPWSGLPAGLPAGRVLGRHVFPCGHDGKNTHTGCFSDGSYAKRQASILRGSEMLKPQWSRLPWPQTLLSCCRHPAGAGLCRAPLRPTEDWPSAPVHPVRHLCLLQPPGSESTDRALPRGHGSAVASRVSLAPASPLSSVSPPLCEHFCAETPSHNG